MKKIEIEHWALRVIDAAVSGKPSEDDRVEMKAQWLVDDHDFARRIAGHANAARGEPILWLFGVDEKGRKVPGVETRDYASWWPRVQTFFDGAAPSPTFVNVTSGDVVVAALCLETDRSPYVVTNAQFGTSGVKISYEVPWRENTSTRTARREDLLRILVPAVRVPTLTLMSLKATAPGGQPKNKKVVHFAGTGYLTHLAEDRVHLPDHLVSGTVTSASGGVMPVVKAKLTPTMQYDRAHDRHVSASPMFIRSDDELAVLGPGTLTLDAVAEIVQPRDDGRRPPADDFDDFNFEASCVIELRFGVLGADRAMLVRARLAPAQPTGEQLAAWRWDGKPR